MQYDLSVGADSNPVLSDELLTTRKRVAGLLLHCASTKEQQRHFSQSEMATALDTSWNLVNNSLILLKEESAIRIERHKMVVNKNKLERILINKE
jgi:hypothetical protein